MPPSEVALYTTDDGTDLVIAMPKNKDVDGLAMLLATVFFRYAEGDEAWIDEMAAWADKHIPE